MSCPHTLRPHVTKLPFLGTLDLLPKDMPQCLKITQKVSFYIAKNIVPNKERVILVSILPKIATR